MVKNNSDTAMKAQMTLDRMRLELRDSSSIWVLTDNSLITYKVSGYNPFSARIFPRTRIPHPCPKKRS